MKIWKQGNRAGGCGKGEDAGKIHLAFLDQVLLESPRRSQRKVSLISEHTPLKAAGEPCTHWGLTLHRVPTSVYALIFQQRWLCPCSSPLPGPRCLQCPREGVLVVTSELHPHLPSRVASSLCSVLTSLLIPCLASLLFHPEPHFVRITDLTNSLGAADGFSSQTT